MDTEIQLGPGSFGACDAFLGSQALIAQIQQAAEQFIAHRDPGPMEITRGCTLLPIVYTQGIRRFGCHLVMVMTPEALTGAWFAQHCAEAGLDTSVTAAQLRHGLSGLKEGKVHDPAQLFSLLNWAAADLQHQDEDRHSIDEFCHKLMQSYEEMNLMYRISASMKCLPDPRQMMQTTCDELVDVLPFTWGAAVFDSSMQVVPDLTGRVVSSGQCPGSKKQFSDLSRRALEESKTKQRDVEIQQQGAMVDLALSEVLAAPITLGEEIVGLLLAGGKSGQNNEHEVCSAEVKMLRASADFLGLFVENAAAFHEQKTLFLGTLRALTATIDAKDQYTCGHSERVAMLAHQLARAAGMTEEEAHQAHVAGLMHDVGKIGIPESVLGKVGRLNNTEYDQVKQHPVIGHRILKDIPQLHEVLDGVLYHHERFDGRGYPHGLAGKRIPLLGRLLAVCDTFDAMSSTRAYRNAMPRHEVFDEIKCSAGTQLDPDLVKVFLKLDLSDYEVALSQHQDAVLQAA